MKWSGKQPGPVVYIAGKVTGDPEYKEKFRRMEEKLRGIGLAVLNPATLPEDLPRESYMPICLAMLSQADAVLLLPDWKESEGAKIEESLARYQCTPVIYPDILDDPEFWKQRPDPFPELHQRDGRRADT